MTDKRDERESLDHLGDMGVEAVVEMGRKKIKLSRVRRLQEGDVIGFDRLAGEAFDVIINGTSFAKGEIVAVGDKMACRLTRLLGPVQEREV